MNGTGNERTSFTLEGISAICCVVVQRVHVLKTENTVRVHLCTGSKQDYKIDKLKHMVQKGSLRGGRKGREVTKREGG